MATRSKAGWLIRSGWRKHYFVGSDHHRDGWANQLAYTRCVVVYKGVK